MQLMKQALYHQATTAGCYYNNEIKLSFVKLNVVGKSLILLTNLIKSEEKKERNKKEKRIVDNNKLAEIQSGQLS